MSPVHRCLQEVSHLSAVTDSTVAERFEAALDELEAAYEQPKERILACDAVLRQLRRIGLTEDAPFGRFIRARIASRQHTLRKYAQ